MAFLHASLLTLVAVLFVYVAALLSKHGRYFYLAFKIPGRHNEWPILGSTFCFIGSLGHATKTMIKLYEENRDMAVFRSWTGPILWVILTDPDIVRKILFNNLHKAFFYDLIGGQGLLEHNHLPKWAKHRKLIGTSFHHSALKSYVRIFHEEANLLADKMKPLADSRQAFESNQLVVLATLGSFVRSVYDVDLRIQQKYYSKHPYLEAVESSFQIFLIRLCKPWLLLQVCYKMFGYKAQVRNNAIVQKSFIEKILQDIKHKMTKQYDANGEIPENESVAKYGTKGENIPENECFAMADTRRSVNESVAKYGTKGEIPENEQYSTNIPENECFAMADTRRSVSFVEKVLKQKADLENFANNNVETVRKHETHPGSNYKTDINTVRNVDSTMTDRELFREMLGLTNGGFDTVRTLVSITLNILAIHPEIQQQVYEEINSVMGDTTTTAPTYEELQELKLLTRVIKESLRMYPGIPFIGRSSPRDLECEGYTIPAGATIAVFIYGIHRDPKHWPNPDHFDPDRFLPSECEKRNPNTYLPFSLGPRNCIGYKYAMLYMETTLSTILRRYRVLPGDKCRSMEDIGFEFGMTLRTLPGNDIRLEARNST